MEIITDTPSLEQLVSSFRKQLPENLVDEFAKIEQALGMHDPEQKAHRKAAEREVCIAVSKCLDDRDLQALEAALDRIRGSFSLDAVHHAFDKIRKICLHSVAIKELCATD